MYEQDHDRQHSVFASAFGLTCSKIHQFALYVEDADSRARRNKYVPNRIQTPNLLLVLALPLESVLLPRELYVGPMPQPGFKPPTLSLVLEYFSDNLCSYH